MAKKQIEQTEIEAPYELPEGWEWCRWGDIGKFIAGNGFKEKFQGFTNLNIPFYKVGSLKFSDSYGILYDKTNTINEDILKELKANLIPTNSIIFAKIGEAIRLNRRSLNSEPCCIDNNLMAFICTECNYKYVFYWSKSLDLYNYTNATTVPAIRKSDLENILFPLPSTLEEQQRIVNRIETLFAKLDQAKEKAQNVVDTFETRKASILHKAFTGELTKKWRAENGIGENQELELIKKYAEHLSKKDILNISTFQEFAEDFILDDGSIWKKCQIGAIGIVTNGSTPSRKESSYWNGTIPWVSSGEVANNIIEFTNECISEEGFNNSSVKKLPVGTVLIAMVGEGKTRGQSSILNIEATTNQNIAAIIINHGRVEPKLLWYWLQKEYKNNREAGNGSGPQALNCQRVRELSFILPTFPEQQEIVRILDCVLEKENQAKQAAIAVLEQIDLLKKSILARAFRGKL